MQPGSLPCQPHVHYTIPTSPPLLVTATTATTATTTDTDTFNFGRQEGRREQRDDSGIFMIVILTTESDCDKKARLVYHVSIEDFVMSSLLHSSFDRLFSAQSQPASPSHQQAKSSSLSRSFGSFLHVRRISNLFGPVVPISFLMVLAAAFCMMSMSTTTTAVSA